MLKHLFSVKLCELCGYFLLFGHLQGSFTNAQGFEVFPLSAFSAPQRLRES